MSSDTYEWHHGPEAEQRGATAREDGFGRIGAVWLPDLPGHQIRIDRADPRILISDLMMDLVRDGHTYGCTIDGDLLTFTAVNGTWTYRLGERLEDRHATIATLAAMSSEEARR